MLRLFAVSNRHTTRRQQVRSGALFGIGLMLLGVFLFAMNDVMGKWLVATYSVGQVLLLRSIAAFAVLLPIMRRQGVQLAVPPRPGLHASRIVLSTFEGAAFYWAVTYLPLADVMTYYLAGADLRRGFRGIPARRKTRPSAHSRHRGRLRRRIDRAQAIARHPLAPCPDRARRQHVLRTAMITTRKLRDTPDATLVLGQILGALVFGALRRPSPGFTHLGIELAALFLLGIVSMAGHACVNRSLILAPASIVAPYQYTLIIWAIVLGYLAFGDIVEFWTLVGAGVICVAGLILLFLERRRGDRGRIPQDIEKPILPEI